MSSGAPQLQLSPFGILLIALVQSNNLIVSTEWWGNVGNAIEQVNVGLFLASPLIAGVTAYLVQPWVSPGFRRLTGLGPGRFGVGRTLLSAYLTGFLNALLAYALVLTAALITAFLGNPTDRVNWFALLYGLIPMALAVSMGILVTVFISVKWSPVLAAVMTLGLAYISILPTQSSLFMVGGWRDLVGWSYAPAPALYWGASLAVVFVVLLAGSAFLLLNRSQLGIMCATLGLVLIAAAGAAPSSVTNRIVLDDAAPEVICRVGVVEYCFAAGHTRLIEQQLPVLNQVASVLAPLVTPFPTAFAETGPGLVKPQAGRALLLLTINPNNEVLSLWDAAYALTDPSACDAMRDDDLSDEGRALLDVQYTVATWTAFTATDDPELAKDLTQSRPAIAPLSPAEIDVLYGSLAMCHVSDQAQQILSSARDN